MCEFNVFNCNALSQHIRNIHTTNMMMMIPFVCKTFRVMLMTEGMHMLKITISVITGITMATCIQKKSQIIDRHWDYVPMILHFNVLYLLSVWVPVFLSVYAFFYS